MRENIYAVILEKQNGGQQMRTFFDRNEAKEEAKEVAEQAKEAGFNGRVYLSPLRYDRERNVITSSKLINSRSRNYYEKQAKGSEKK